MILPLYQLRFGMSTAFANVIPPVLQKIAAIYKYYLQIPPRYTYGTRAPPMDPSPSETGTPGGAAAAGTEGGQETAAAVYLLKKANVLGHRIIFLYRQPDLCYNCHASPALLEERSIPACRRGYHDRCSDENRQENTVYRWQLETPSSKRCRFTTNFTTNS